jgi:predicted nucleic acid-binding protein
VGETYTWLRYHTGYRSAERWLHEEAALHERGALEVVYPTAETDSGVWRTLSRFADQDLSYVDAFSLHVVHTRVDIDAIFAFDHHLSLYGAAVLPGDG